MSIGIAMISRLRKRVKIPVLGANLVEKEPAILAATIPAAEPPTTVIEPRPGWRLPDLRELWRYRELLFFLTWRDVKVRYKQTALGVLWVVLQPLATMAVFSLFLAKVGGIADRVENYPLFVLAGLLPWGFFSNAVAAAAGSVVGNQNLVTKVYFPRLIIPVSAAGAGLVDFLICLVVFAILIPILGGIVGWGLILLPVIIILLAVAALGVGILLAALTVAYRDFRYVVPFMIQLWMFATPSIYLPVEGVLGSTTQSIMPVNPAYGLILNFRACALDGSIDWYSLLVSATVSVGLFVAGCLYFRRVERSFADVI